MIRNILLVGTGGFLGSILRYVFYLFYKAHQFPLATFTVNIIGSLLIGVIMAYIIKFNLINDWKLFLVTGICGGFTTFSALSWEFFQLFHEQKYFIAFGYVLVSLFIGFLATFIGYFMINK